MPPKKYKLLNGETATKSSLPRAKNFRDLSGQMFGEWKVIAFGGKQFSKQGSRSEWICQCECGSYSLVSTGNLASGASTRCVDCGNVNFCAKTHGLSRTPIYSKWHGLKQNHKTEICKRWLDFQKFYEDVGDPPTPKYHLIRKKKSQLLGPKNFKWVTRSEMMCQTSPRARLLTVGKQTMCMSRWARQIGISNEGLRLRLKRHTVEDAVLSEKGELPHRAIGRPAKKYTVGKKTLTLKEWSQALEITKSTLALRLKKYPPEIALSKDFITRRFVTKS